jgi:hypothetical protein
VFVEKTKNREGKKEEFYVTVLRTVFVGETRTRSSLFLGGEEMASRGPIGQERQTANASRQAGVPSR